MDRVYLASEFTFDAAHKLHNYEGKCKQLHGHTYKLQVTICGIPDITTGLLVDFNDLKRLVKTMIVDKLDHRNLTDFFDDCYVSRKIGGMNTTVENICIWIWNTLYPAHLPQLYEITLWETPTCYATYRGGG